MRHAAKLAVLSTLLPLALACTANRQYAKPPAPDQMHLSLQENPRDCEPPAQETNVPELDCRLAIVELDDQGSFWNPDQLENAKGEIVERSRHDRQAIVIVFIHGWNHDARRTDKNLRSFDRVLGEVALLERARATGDEPDPEYARPVVGVFLSWRGRSLVGPLNIPLSFYNRKAAAERVARLSAAHTIHRLVAKTKGFKEGTGLTGEERTAPEEEQDDDGNPESVFVIVGHSFGGLILENTLLRSLTQETDDFSQAFPADLAVLVNPANEAVLGRQFVQALQKAPPAIIERKTEDTGHRWSGPGVVSVTSKGDTATRRWFHLAQSLKSSLLRLRDRQRFYYTRTPGHTGVADGLISHQIRCQDGGDDCPGIPEKAGEWRQRNLQRMNEMVDQARTEDSLYPRPVVTPGECEREAEERRNLCCIEKIELKGGVRDDGTPQRYRIDRVVYSGGLPEEDRNRTIYWTFRVPRQVIPNHGEVFDSEFRSLLGALIMLKQGNFEVSSTDPDWGSKCKMAPEGP